MHFMLVDELMKHGMRRPEAQMGIMDVYPDGAHWVGAIVGKISGSGLVAIVMVTVVSVYVCYVLLLELLGKDSPIKVALAAIAFVLLARTHSLIGWEVRVNYFYSQIVGDVVLLATLLMLCHLRSEWKRALMVFFIGASAMYIHALIALQILACGLTCIAWSGIMAWRATHRFPFGILATLLALLAGAVAILAFHPSFRAMRMAAENDGYLKFGYSYVFPVIVACGAIGCMMLWRARDRVDTVLGCAGIATVLLALLQYGALHLGHAGSAYAVKKHMFVVVSLATLSAIRLVGGRKPGHWTFGWLVAPVLAGLASFHVLALFETPVSPVIRAIAYANHVAQFELPGFKPGNTVSADEALPPMINFAISTTAFQQPFSEKQTTWIYGADPTVDATYAMVRRTPEIDAKCERKYGKTTEYVVVETACLR
ncbi:hypothetical protein KZJ38_16230 [Paraburkholderia edwinii]|uniref:Uncharacterized protein n=1 Tax=Paraburkholderia edwinii TaxID=2861782 RepID=A0ABX8UGV3_9BURK|nr:hypothetical protein [Paraburkholderia edwinii]QYD67856.1 hypothetical protein KZJ38_16230 [Paraburkholderia edwinii]